jgi:tetratricopeptide (TPR) repeat protein
LFALAISAVYWPVYNYEFVKYDDDTYLIKNTNIQSGLNFKSFRWAFTAGYESNWHPVTWLSHMLDYQLFGKWAGGHHLTNVLFHILNTIILFYVLMRLTGSIWPSAFVAAVFALHPLHVESVAWVAERKDVLSTLFWLLTMWAYVRYVENPGFRWYLAAIILFVLGLMSKPMLVTVPFVLLLLDYWPLQRKISYRLLTEKIPFFICAAISGVVTFLVQKSSGSMADIKVFGLTTRINNAIVSYVMYITKMFWPSRLAVLYLHPGDGLPMTMVFACGFLLMLISICFIIWARRHKFLIAGWLWYLGTLVPVIGLIQVGEQAMADRYSYMTLTGLLIIIAWSAKEFAPKWHHRNTILALLAVIISAALALTSSQQLKCWKNSLTLFEYALRVDKDNYIMRSNYATYLGEIGRLDEAIEQFNELLKTKSDLPEIQNNFGNALLKSGGNIQQAIEHFRLAIKYKPDFPPAYLNLANALKKQGRLEEAVSYYKQALELKPDLVDAYMNLAIALKELKRFDEAIECCNKVLEFKPDNIIAHGYLGVVLAAVNKNDEAIREIRFVLNARPDDAEMHRNLGILLERKGQISEAIESYRTSLQIDPKNTETNQLLEDALKKQGATK